MVQVEIETFFALKKNGASVSLPISGHKLPVFMLFLSFLSVVMTIKGKKPEVFKFNRSKLSKFIYVLKHRVNFLKLRNLA